VLLEAFNRKEAAALGFFPCATASFCFAQILWGSKREDSNSPCPALCVTRGRNAPVGRFWGAAWRIPSGALKSALQCTLAMRFLV
jgi:hypothetical protein